MNNIATFPKSQLEYRTPSLTTSSRLMTLYPHFRYCRRLKEAYDDDYAAAAAAAAAASVIHSIIIATPTGPYHLSRVPTTSNTAIARF
jgi:hypothetical protein